MSLVDSLFFALSCIDETTVKRKEIIVLMLIFTSSEPLKLSETGACDPTPFVRSKGATKFSVVPEAQQSCGDLMAKECPKDSSPHGTTQKMVWLSHDSICFNIFTMIEEKHSMITRN